MRGILACALLSVTLAGCSQGGDLSKKDEGDLRSNFTRPLTPEEIKKLNSAPPPSGAGPSKAPPSGG